MESLFGLQALIRILSMYVTIALLSVQGTYLREVAGMCLCVRMYVLSVCVCVCAYDVRGDQDFCSQPYLTSSQSCYIKNRDFARARFEKSAKKLRAKRPSRNTRLHSGIYYNYASTGIPRWQDSDINIGDFLSLSL